MSDTPTNFDDVTRKFDELHATMQVLTGHARRNADAMMELLQVIQRHAQVEEDRMAHFEAHVLLLRQELNVVRADLLAMRVGSNGSVEGDSNG